MYDDILFPYDGSEGAAEVLHHASELAHRFDATVHLLYVADTKSDSVTVVDNKVVDALVREGESVLEDGAKTLETLGVEHDTTVVQGDPATTIVEYAERNDHDLVVMPSHGRKGLSRYLIGSVSEKVVRLSPVPVLTVRMRPDESLAFPYENVLIATDGSEDAMRAARHGIALAAALDATVHALSAIEVGSLGPDVRSVMTEDVVEQSANDAIDALVSEADRRGVADVVRHVEYGSPVETILECIEANDVDAVVMGTTGRRRTDRILLGSVAEKTVRSAPVPVLTVRREE